MSPPFGPAAQGEIYVGSADDLALDPDEWESRAKSVLEPGPFDYIAGGARGQMRLLAKPEAVARAPFRPPLLPIQRVRVLQTSALLAPGRAASVLRAAPGYAAAPPLR